MAQEEYYLLVLDVDPTRLYPVHIIHAYRDGDQILPSKKPNHEYDMVTDMSKLCEGLCLMMHVENNEGKQKDVDSLKMCIDYLKTVESPHYKPNREQTGNDAFLIDINPENGKVSIVHLNRTYDDQNPTENGDNNITTMNNICEGLSMLIYMAHASEEKDKKDSLEDCINHLKKGFADASYEGSTVDNW